MLCNRLKINEDEAYWLTDFHLGVCQERTHFKWYVLSKYKETFVILQSIAIIVIKCTETRAVIYTCGYSLIHII